MTTGMSDHKPAAARAPTHDDARLEGVHIRLRATRRVCRMGSVSEAAAALGVVRSRWSNWENDYGIPPPHLLVKLRQRYPAVCLNYIYGGDTNGIAPSVAHELREVEARLRKT